MVDTSEKTSTKRYRGKCDSDAKRLVDRRKWRRYLFSPERGNSEERFKRHMEFQTGETGAPRHIIYKQQTEQRNRVMKKKC